MLNPVLMPHSFPEDAPELSNAGLITALFGGKSKSARETAGRKKRVLDLLKVAAPNRALERDRQSYEALLDGAISGAD